MDELLLGLGACFIVVLVVLWKWIAKCSYVSWCCTVYLTARIIIVLCAHVHSVLVTVCDGMISQIYANLCKCIVVDGCRSRYERVDSERG